MIRPVPFAVLFLLAGALPGGAPVGDQCTGKPLPSVEVVWQAPDPQTPGEILAAELRIVAHRPGVRVRVEIPAGRAREQIRGPLPAYEGSPTPGEPVVLAVAFRVPDASLPPLEARVEVESEAGRYQVGAGLDLTPLSLRPRIPPGRAVAAASGPLLEYAARPLESSFPSMPPRAAGPAKVVTLSGRFLYRDRPFDPDGFLYADNDSNPVFGVPHADLDLIVNSTVVATGSTDSTGCFAFTRNLMGSEVVQVRVTSSTARWGGTTIQVKVTGSSTLFAAATPPLSGISADTDLGAFVLEPGQGGEAMNVLDRLLEGAREVAILSGSWPTDPFTAYWSAVSQVGTYYSRSQNAIYLRGEDGYDDSVVLHEYGHSVAFHYSNDDSPGGEHYVDDGNQDPQLSWSEGFASFFQSLVRTRLGDPYPSWYIDTRGSPGAGQLYFSYEAEGPGTLINATGIEPMRVSLYLRGVGNEIVVHAALWDVVDGPATPGDLGPPGIDDDGVVAPPSEIWEVLTGPLLTAQYVTLEDFWVGWFDPAVANGFEAEMAAAFTALGVELVPDGAEDDADPAQSALLLTDGTPVHHTFYPAGDLDHHRLDLEAGESVTVETVNLAGYGDTDLQILAPDQSPIAENDDRYPGEIGSAVSFVAAQTGSYTVRVSRSFADARSQFVSFGAYDVRAVAGDTGELSFAEVSTASGTDNRGFGVGTAFADFDRDGLPDLMVVNNDGAGIVSGKDVLYRNDGNFSFSNVTADAGLGRPEGGVGAAWGDADNDGDPDLFLTDHALYRNEGNGTFTKVTAASGVVDVGREFDAAWVDTDVDGDLDLFVVRRDGPSALWRNEGGWIFVDVAGNAGFDFPADGGNAYGCAWGDYDGDALPDLFLALRDQDAQRLYRNLGGNRFEDVTATAGLVSTVPACGAAWGDVNGDGFLDLFVASAGADRLYLNRGDGTFTDVAPMWGVDDLGLATGCGFADADLDGDLDLFVSVQGQPSLLYLNHLEETMVRTSQAATSGPGWGCAWGDADGDGDPDLYQAVGCDAVCEANLFYRNLAVETSPRAWLKVALVGDASNRDGIGARIVVRAGGRRQGREAGTGVGWASKSRLPELFGLGAATGIDSVEVFWPSGTRDVVHAPPLNALLVVQESSSTPVRPPGERPPFTLRLGAPVPNPFWGAASVTVTLSGPARVTVDVFGLAGRRIRRLLDRELAEGTHVVGWDGEDGGGNEVPPGVYFYRAAAAGETEVLKLVRIGR